MVKKNANILLIILIIVGLIFLLPKLGLFTTIPYTSQCELPSCPSGYTDIGATCEDTTRLCTRNCQQIVQPSCGSYSSESVVKTLTQNLPQSGIWYSTSSYETIDTYCYKYKTYSEWTLTGMNVDSKTLTVYTKDGSSFSNSKTTTSSSATVSVTSSVETLMGSGPNLEAAGKVSGRELWSYDTSNLIVKLYVSRADYTPGGTYNSQTTCTYQTCTEGQVVITQGVYKICHNEAFQLITDLVLLTPAEQAAVMAQINELQLTVEQKAKIIANLTTTINGQATMITQLQATTAEKALIIQQLSANITYQTQLISQMKLTVNEQAATIDSLTSNINTQATMINQLTTNLATKAALVSQLTVTNEQQAQLITAMSLSFAQQAGIITQLNNTIKDDAQVIKNLNLNLADQATLITSLQLQRDQLAQLVASMNLSNSDTAKLINDLQLTVNDQIVIINQLNRSVQDEQILVNQLRLTIEQQNQIIADLQSGNIPSSTFDFQGIWVKYKMWIIIGGGVILLLLILGGKKR